MLGLACLKTLLACSILWGCERQIFFTKSESMKSATAFLPLLSASIRSFAMQGLAGTPKDKKYSSLSSKLELKGLVKHETAPSTRFTLHLSRLNTFLFHFSALKSCFNILSSDVMSNTPFNL